MKASPWFYGYTLSQLREHVRCLTDVELQAAFREVEAATIACERQGDRGAWAAETNGRKLRVIEHDIARRRVRIYSHEPRSDRPASGACATCGTRAGRLVFDQRIRKAFCFRHASRT